MVCVCRRPGYVTAKTIAVTAQMNPAALTILAVKISSRVQMVTVCPEAMYVTLLGTAQTAQMKTRYCAAEPRPPRAPGGILIAVMGNA